MLALPPTRPRKRPSLTPMIDVVFLLLIFFMLASQFGKDLILPLNTGDGAGTFHGPPRLVSFSSDGTKLNGTPVTLADLAERLRPLTSAQTDAIILRALDDAPLQDLMDAAASLRQAGFSNLMVME